MKIAIKGVPRRSFLVVLGVAPIMLLTIAGESAGGPSSFGPPRESFVNDLEFEL